MVGANHPVVESAAPRHGVEAQVGVDALDFFGHETGKRRAYWVHAQAAHALEYFVLKGNLVGVPFFRQRTVDVADVAHAHPRQVRRTHEVTSDFVVGEPEAFPHACSDCLVSHQRQRHVDAVQCHPIDFLFPSLPVPIGSGVAIGYHVEIVVMLNGRHHRSRGSFGKRRRSRIAIAAPTVDAQMVAAHKIVDAAAQCYSIAAFHGQAVAVDVLLVGRFAMGCRHGLQGNVCRQLRESALNHLACGIDFSPVWSGIRAGVHGSGQG